MKFSLSVRQIHISNSEFNFRHRHRIAIYFSVMPIERRDQNLFAIVYAVYTVCFVFIDSILYKIHFLFPWLLYDMKHSKRENAPIQCDKWCDYLANGILLFFTFWIFFFLAGWIVQMLLFLTEKPFKFQSKMKCSD